MLASVKRTCKARPGVLDTWSLAAGLGGMPVDSLCDGLVDTHDGWAVRLGQSQARLVMLCEGSLRNVKLSSVLAKLPVQAVQGEYAADVHGEWGTAVFVGAMSHRMGSVYAIPFVLGSRGGRLLRGAVTLVARLPFEGGSSKRPLAGLWGQGVSHPQGSEWFHMCGVWLLAEGGGCCGRGGAAVAGAAEPFRRLKEIFGPEQGRRGAAVAGDAALPLVGDGLDGTIGFMCPDNVCWSDGTSMQPFACFVAAAPHCTLPPLEAVWATRIWPWTHEAYQSAAQLLRQRLLGLMLERGKQRWPVQTSVRAPPWPRRRLRSAAPAARKTGSSRRFRPSGTSSRASSPRAARSGGSSCRCRRRAAATGSRRASSSGCSRRRARGATRRCLRGCARAFSRAAPTWGRPRPCSCAGWRRG